MFISYSSQPYHLQILNASKEYGDNVAITNYATKQSITYNTLRKKSYQLAAGFFNQIELKKKDIILVLLPNSIEFVEVFLSTSLLGGTISGINPSSTKEEIDYYVKLTKSKCLVCHSDNYSKVEHLVDILKVIVIDKKDHQIGEDFDVLIRLWNNKSVTELEEILPNLDIQMSDILITPFSSGTTGKPKCCLISHRNFSCITFILKHALFDQISNGIKRATLAILPFFHVSGFWPLCYCLLEGHHSIVLEEFNTMMTLEIIEKYRIDVINIVPSIINFFCKNKDMVKKYDVSSVKTALVGSAPLGRGMSEEFLKVFPSIENLLQGYGMTELCVLSHITPLGNVDGKCYDKKLGSVGKLLPGFEAKIVDSEMAVEIFEPDMTGELWLKSDAIMVGYLNDEESTNEAIDFKGWLHTGDIVSFDKDGFYYVTGRIKELIKVHGLQVSPNEIEDKLKKHEAVFDCGVIGVSCERCGEVPKAFVVLKEGCENVKEVDILNWLHKIISPYKHIKGGIQFVSEIPRTPNGKLLRNKLKEINENKVY
ncbi:Acyl-CoA synthetase family member 2, mitochondrial [Strongyloides ratti]|uniref:Acyl-CoA synthetase family member 2, mitochondrial n=1 Tax=Strongyloides ratti TaxID=34506 RepID=A0A090LRT0_STRRB|nr:Acyl-CoA synthetase family member 2, mitochondrial [Strongyloides ratti]CEF70281.1 Acyl-CoA synthetase family member 2, mitochondrial [Strongyloides ratti]